MLPRAVQRLIRKRLDAYPAVALMGPRQCGKTTLARSLGGSYFDLERESDRLKIDIVWPTLLRSRSLVVLDEAQAWPAIFPRLRAAIDAERRINGRFLLLGSVSPSLMTKVSESLAGRISIVALTPFTFDEIRSTTHGPSAIDALWLRGGYPDGGILKPDRFPQWQRDYADLIAQRDLPSWGLPAKPQVTGRLFRMLAALHGQIWNASQVAQGLGLSYPTVNSYLEYLEGAFLIRQLRPYHANLRKRLVRRPKVYWRDSGLLHALLLVGSDDDLRSKPWVGASWEGFVIEQILATLAQRGVAVEPWFLRTSDQYEIDLLLDFGRTMWAVETKLTSDPSPHDFDRLRKTANMVGADACFLVSRVAESVGDAAHASCDLPWLLRRLPAK